MIGQINAWVAAAAPPGPGPVPAGHRLPWGAPAPVFVGGAWGAQNVVLRFNHATLANVVTALTNAAAGHGAREPGLARERHPAHRAARGARGQQRRQHVHHARRARRRRPQRRQQPAHHPAHTRPEPPPGLGGRRRRRADLHRAPAHVLDVVQLGIFSACLPVPGGDQHACTLARLDAAPGTGEVFATPVNIANYRNNNGWSRVLYIPPVPPLAANLQPMQELWHPRTKISSRARRRWCSTGRSTASPFTGCRTTSTGRSSAGCCCRSPTRTRRRRWRRQRRSRSCTRRRCSSGSVIEVML